MLKPNRLSHTACNRFLTCGESYRLHYVERLRPTVVGSALLFGGAVDKALEALCKGDLGYINVFEKAWTYPEINGELVFLPTSSLVRYSKADLDAELIAHLPQDTSCNPAWISLREKGLLMLEAAKNVVLPKLKVLDTQVAVSLSNGVDSISGSADLVAHVDGYEKPVVLDWKTTSVPYKDDSVLESPQLSLYVHALSEKYDDTRLGGYITLNKRIKKVKTATCQKCGAVTVGARHKTCNASIGGKRCDGQLNVVVDFGVDIQIIIDEIPESRETLTINNFDQVNEDVKEQRFYRNEDSCVQKWGKCEFYDYCHSGNSMEGLVHVPEKSK